MPEPVVKPKMYFVSISSQELASGVLASSARANPPRQSSAMNARISTLECRAHRIVSRMLVARRLPIRCH